MKNIQWLFLLCVLLGFAGCNSNVAMSGKVTFSDDGSPLTVGTVIFKKGNLISKGNLQPDGTFVIGSMSESDGLAPGTYQVYISGADKDVIPPGKDASYAYLVPLIDPKHSKPETSGLSVDVTKATKNFELQVERYDPNKKR